MKRRQFVSASLLAGATLATADAKSAQPAPKQKELYELRTYELRFGSPQSNLENYLKDALIPALNRQGVRTVGVFREMGKSDPAKLYVLIPHTSMESYVTAASRLTGDSAYATASQAYNQLTPDRAPYARYSTSLLSAFDALPQLIVPAKEGRIFEIRTYEGYSEDAVRRKIKMFNVDELPVFYKVKLNPVFFGHVIAGEHMPCLTYMLTFKNMEERDANWKAFSADPDWKRVSGAPEYANTVSNIIRVFLEPAAYSQI
ncbi:MAG TPA: NIPSNAP family protein [Hymenobacter sp.]|nr:NIPSNAP family protein [Hymenobacter sp.]